MVAVATIIVVMDTVYGVTVDVGGGEGVACAERGGAWRTWTSCRVI